MIAQQVKIYSCLPTERYLKKFLSNKVEINPDYILSNKDKFGSFVYVCLQNSKYNVVLNDKRFNDHIKITIPLGYEKLQKKEFCEDGIHLTNQFIKLWFYEDFVNHMKLFDMFSLRMDKSIKTFCEINDLELDVDIQYDTLKKKYYRWREKKGQPLQKYIIELVNED